MASELVDELVEEFAFFEGLLETGMSFVQNYAWQLLAAAIIVIIGYIVSAKLQKIVVKFGTKREIDRTLITFLAGVVRILVLAFTLMITLSKLGITISPLIAAIGAGLFGATFAIQAPIANYAAGLGIILLRPYKLDDVITVQGQSGRVEEITLAMTYIRNEDGERIQVPNKFIMGEIIVNSGEVQLVVGKVGISYESDPAETVEHILEILKAHDTIEQDPAPRVGVSKFGDFAIQISYRYRVPAEQFHTMQFDINGAIYQKLRDENISIPYPQQEIRLLGSNS